MSWLATISGRLLREPRHLVASLRLLVFASLAVLGVSSPPVHLLPYWLVTIVYGLTVFGYMLARNREYRMPRVRYFLFLFDVLTVCGLIVIRGQEVQGLVMAYAMLILLAAILVGVGTAVVNAIVVSGLYTAVTSWGQPPEALLSLHHIGPVCFFFVMALFMGHVAAQARPRSGRGRAGRVAARYASALGVTTTKLRESTEQLRAARETLRANERLFTLGMLSAGIAHEIKIPVAAILASVAEVPGMLDEIDEGLQASHPAADAVKELRSVVLDCEHAAAQLQRISLDLSNLVRGGSTQVRVFDPDESLLSAARMLRKAAGDTVELCVESEATLHVHADPGRLMQILLNLAGNAIDAMNAREGGTLCLRSEDAGEDRVAFLVSDTGPGISPEVQERMYDPFYTTKGPGKGTGLGLHLVSEIVHAQEGSIDCDSCVGGGTTFRVELPALPASQGEEGSHVEGTQDTAHRGRRGDDSPGPGSHAAA